MCVYMCLSVTLWTVAYQAPLSIGFSRQGYWSELPFPTPGIFPTQGSNVSLLHWQVDSLPLGSSVKWMGWDENRALLIDFL